MAYKVCQDCGTIFAAKADYYRLCFSCWKKNQPAAPEIGRLTLQNIKLQFQAAEAAAEIRNLQRLLDAAEARARTAGGRVEEIPDDMLKILVQLSHPDRHSGSAAANRATAWLLKQRKRD